MSTIKIQAAITGYQGKAINLLGALDTDSGLFIVAKELPFEQCEEGAVIVSNDPRAPQRDSLFDEEKLKDAITLYFRSKSTGMLELMANVTKHDPGNLIESQGVDETGTRYRLSPDIGNGHVAILALVEAASRAYTAQEMTSFSAEIADMFLSI